MSDSFPATYIMHTPTGPVPSCDHHAKKVAALMNFLGAHTNATVAPPGTQCVNCVNESQKNPRVGDGSSYRAEASRALDAKTVTHSVAVEDARRDASST